MRISRRIFPLFGALIIVGLAGGTVGRAALQWETTRIQLTASPQDRTAVAHFRFSNPGPAAITIRDTHTTCGCTTATLEKRTYAAGEAGEITVNFDFGARLGEQEKTVQVVTDDPVEPATRLILSVNIPELLTYSPRLLYWRLNEAGGEKSVPLAAASSVSIAKIELTAPVPPEVSARLEPVEEGRSYRLTVRPLSMSRQINVSLPGEATFSDGTKRAFSIYALVR